MVVIVVEKVLKRDLAVSKVHTTPMYSRVCEIDERANVDTGHVRSSQTRH